MSTIWTSGGSSTTRTSVQTAWSRRRKTCSVCGERIWSDNNAGDSDTPLCQSCYERLYTNCTRCGALIPNARVFYAWDDVGNEEPLCRDCYSHSTRPKAIQDYYYKPDPIFYGKGPRYFGVELEIDGAGECSENAQEILDLANGERELVYCKHDGSLNDGFEIVTHPMALKFHQKNMPWREILREAVSMGYRSHQAGTCGLHVHVSRAAFGETYQEQDSAIARVLYFFEKHWEELLKFSRRTPRQLEHWAARYGYKEHPKDILDHAKKGDQWKPLYLRQSPERQYHRVSDFPRHLKIQYLDRHIAAR